ncbi:MAG: DUF1501 domain-containing protein [Marinomonas sp.]
MSLSRRQFIRSSAQVTVAANLAIAGAAPVYSAPSSSANKNPLVSIKPESKALVFIMLDGGNDAFNMLVPSSNPHYQEYKKTRSNLALDQSELLSLSGFKDQDGRHFGLHPSMPEVKHLFEQNKLAFVANIGPMITPVDKSLFYNQSANLPLGLMSHSDQFKHWQTARPELRINRGWFGLLSDSLQANQASPRIPMNISLAGNNIMQNGFHSGAYSITDEGSVGLVINEVPNQLNKLLLKNFEASLNQNYPNDPFRQSYLSMTRQSQAQHQLFKEALEGTKLKTQFSNTELSQQLRKVAQSIKSAKALGHKQQTFFLRYIGWDHHDELLNNQGKMLKVLSKALGEFQQSLDELGLADQVVTFTGSDFGRTLTSNGNGTDHGWGGNTLVMGNQVRGGQVFGQYPKLSLGKDNPLDIGDGVLIPTLATDELYAELALWFGVEKNQLDLLFPNLKNFPTKQGKGSLKGLIRA